MAVETSARAHAAQISGRLRIEFLFLDLTSCTRCLGAGRSLESALDIVVEVLHATGIEVEVDKILVESAEQARALRFVSSPTIRVDGRDVALEVRESSCGSEACTDGCDDQIACRVWVHRGREHTEPPVAMIVDAILSHVYGGPSPRARVSTSGMKSRVQRGRAQLKELLTACCDIELDRRGGVRSYRPLGSTCDCRTESPARPER